MKTFVAIFAASIVVIVSACMFEKINDRDLLGKYHAALPNGGTEDLELQPNGQCLQQIRLPDGTTYKAQGTWKYLPDTEYLQVRGIRAVLTPARQINPKLADPPPDEVFATPVSRSLTGRLTIMLHEGLNYRKL